MIQLNPVLALSAQSSLGIGIAAALAVVWAVFLVAHLRTREKTLPVGSEIELAPNRRPYLDDEAMEGPRLDKVLGFALVLLVVVAVGLPAYWLNEPSRQEGAVVGFDHRAVHRGEVMYSNEASPLHEGNIGKFGCSNCHGVNGEGGAARYVLPGTTQQVTWAAPALDTVLLRFSEEEVARIITYGRPNTPMPPWGVVGGGAMNEQQVTDLVAYIKSIQLTPDEAREQAEQYGTDGEELFNAYCARCHTEGWSWNKITKTGTESPEERAARLGLAGGGAFGPNLTNGVTLRQFPEPEDHLEFIRVGSDFEKPYGVRGIGSGRMPGFGAMLTDAQIEAIVEYERGL